MDDEATCAVPTIFPCYENWSKEIKFLKAGMITVEQIETPMTSFPHGSFINPHVLRSQLTHFDPVQKVETVSEDLLNQCRIVLELSSAFHKESELEIDKETLEKILSTSHL